MKSQYPAFDGPTIKKIITASATEEVNFFNKCKSNGRLNAYNALKMAKSYETLKITPKRELANKKVGQIQYRLIRKAN
ncbi:MAG: hypothetical protein A2451_07990 [Bdellovibrionales bacterium RIFOXYC2_FULL_39_8]|nr:MAG: hypothetical protein A2451_07990 [Bdellovibrionales bacterium RIFOXYC2_FULL_39_8]